MYREPLVRIIEDDLHVSLCYGLTRSLLQNRELSTPQCQTKPYMKQMRSVFVAQIGIGIGRTNRIAEEKGFEQPAFTPNENANTLKELDLPAPFRPTTWHEMKPIFSVPKPIFSVHTQVNNNTMAYGQGKPKRSPKLIIRTNNIMLRAEWFHHRLILVTLEAANLNSLDVHHDFARCRSQPKRVSQIRRRCNSCELTKEQFESQRSAKKKQRAALAPSCFLNQRLRGGRTD